jgi:hypothetical protein
MTVEIPLEIIVLILSWIPQQAWRLRRVSARFRQAALCVLQTIPVPDDNLWELPKRKQWADVPEGYPRVFAYMRLNEDCKQPATWHGIRCIYARVHGRSDAAGELFFKEPPRLVQTLEVYDMVRSIKLLESCGQLRRLSFFGSPHQFGDISALSRCTHLRVLEFRINPWIQDISALANCPRLVSLCITGSPLLEDISPLRTCTRLRYLSLVDCKSLQDISPLEDCKSLKHLYLYGNPALSDISVTKNFEGLISLDVASCVRLHDLSALQHCSRLERLYLSGLPMLYDLSPLKGCSQLIILSVEQCPGLLDLSPLKENAWLEILYVDSRLQTQKNQLRTSCKRLHN